MATPFIQLDDDDDDYRVVGVYFPPDSEGEPDYRLQVIYDKDSRTSRTNWERAFPDDCYEDLSGQPPPPVQTAYAAFQQRARTWARTGSDPGDTRRNSLARGTWRAA